LPGGGRLFPVCVALDSRAASVVFLAAVRQQKDAAVPLFFDVERRGGKMTKQKKESYVVSGFYGCVVGHEFVEALGSSGNFMDWVMIGLAVTGYIIHLLWGLHND
jgi:hypothetical protein